MKNKHEIKYNVFWMFVVIVKRILLALALCSRQTMKITLSLGVFIWSPELFVSYILHNKTSLFIKQRRRKITLCDYEWARRLHTRTCNRVWRKRKYVRIQ